MFEISGDKELLAAMVGAILQDLRPPAGLNSDPMPAKSASEAEFSAWIERHTFKQRETGQQFGGFVAGDAVYDHYTARAILNGMPFNARDQRYTLSEALASLGVNDPDRLMDRWRMDAELAARTGDRILIAINGKEATRAEIADAVSGMEEDDDQAAAVTMEMENEGLPCEIEESCVASVYAGLIVDDRFSD